MDTALERLDDHDLLAGAWPTGSPRPGRAGSGGPGWWSSTVAGRLRAAHAEQMHRKAVADRHVRTTELDDGMAQLAINATLDKVRLAEHP